MLSVETFRRISKLSKSLERECEEHQISKKKEENSQKIIDYLNNNYNLVKVYETNNNWHFELQPKYN
jgi:hypothetical protein